MTGRILRGLSSFGEAYRIKATERTPMDGWNNLNPLNSLRSILTGKPIVLDPNFSNSFAERAWVTPQQARLLRRDMHYFRQRDLEQKSAQEHIEELYQEMLRNRFVEGVQVYICVTPDGKMHLVNANQTLEATARMDRPVLLSFWYQLVTDIDEVGKYYARFDIHRMRDWRARARARGADDLLGSKHGWTGAFWACVPFILNGLDQFGEISHKMRSASQDDTRVDVMEQWKGMASDYIAAVSYGTSARTKSSGIFKRVSVMSIGIELFRYQPRKAVDFFEAMAQDGWSKSELPRLERDDPRFTLINYLRNNTVKDTHRNGEFANAVAISWNAYTEGRTLQIIKAKQAEFHLNETDWRRGVNVGRVYARELLK